MDSITASSIFISWELQDCLTRNSEITGYRVEYGRTRPGIGQVMEINIVDRIGTDISARRFLATNLLPRTSYTFFVRPVTSEGRTGPHPAEITRTTGTPEGENNDNESANGKRKTIFSLWRARAR